MKGVWRERGFEALADGTFGNGGQNLYVSRAGVLQRIFRFDVNNNGAVDLIFANSHDFGERPPAYVIDDVLGHSRLTELSTLGSYAGAVGDLNSNGYSDLVIGMQNNGLHTDLTAFIYYGAPEGLSERYKWELPVPDCRGVAIGDWNGSGRPDLAFIVGSNQLRLFYQAVEGFLPDQHVDLEVRSDRVAAADLDGDGYDDLYVRVRGERPRVLWGGEGGIDPQRYTVFGRAVREGSLERWEGSGNLPPILVQSRPKVVRIGGIPHIFWASEDQAHFIPVNPDRSLGSSLVIESGPVLSAAVGDVNGNGFEDVVLAARQKVGGEEVSWVYWGTRQGYDNAHRTALKTPFAADVAVGDLNGNGRDEIVFCQGRGEHCSTTESYVYRGTPEGVDPEPIRFTTHDAAEVFVARTCKAPNPQVIFVNHSMSQAFGRQPIYVYLGGKDGYSPERRIELPGHCAVDVMPCDFNDDGWPDLLVLNAAEDQPSLDPPSYLYWGGPDGFHPQRRLDVPTTLCWGGAVGDINHSGYLDLVAGGTDDFELRVFHGNASGFDVEGYRTIDLSVEKGEQRMCVLWPILADLNNNGWLDLFVPLSAASASPILWGGPEGFSMDRATFLPVLKVRSARAADLTGNGWLDLVLGTYPSPVQLVEHDCSVMIYWGSPQGFSTDRCCMLPAYQTNSMAIADLNNDGILDILACSYLHSRERDLNSYIYWGGPRGGYSPRNRSRLFSHSVSGCFAADLNENGWVDLVLAQHRAYGNHRTESVIWWSGPQGFSEDRRTWLPTIGPHGMCSVEPANIADRGPEEFYASSPYELPPGARVHTISWQADVPAKTWVRAQLRFAPDREELAEAPWQGPGGSKGAWFENAAPVDLSQVGCWVQYRLALGAINGGNTPRITEVRVAYE